MRNKKLIPFEVIENAVAGEPEAIDKMFTTMPDVYLPGTYQRRHSRLSESTDYQSYPAIPF